MTIVKEPRLLLLGFYLSAVILFLTGIAKLHDVLGEEKYISMPNDVFTVLALSNRQVLFAAVVLELFVSAILVSRRVAPVNRALGLCAVSTAFLAYRVGMGIVGQKHCDCIGFLGSWLGLSSEVVSNISLGLLFVLLTTGYGSLLAVLKCRDSEVSNLQSAQLS